MHPVRRFFDSGLFLTINADDPAVLSTDLNKEYLMLLRTFGFSLQEVKGLIGNAVEASFCSSEEKDKLRKLLRGA
jgi:adenosine deaminase